MGSPIHLGSVSPHTYEGMTDSQIKGKALELAQRIESSPWYICGLKDREDVITVLAHLKGVVTILEMDADRQEDEISKRVSGFEFEGKR